MNFKVGQTVSRYDEFQDLPEGTILTPFEEGVRVKLSDGQFAHHGPGPLRTIAGLADGVDYTIEHLPKDYKPEADPIEDLAEDLWKVRLGVTDQIEPHTRTNSWGDAGLVHRSVYHALAEYVIDRFDIEETA